VKILVALSQSIRRAERRSGPVRISDTIRVADTSPG
jgi:hypothetical protein